MSARRTGAPARRADASSAPSADAAGRRPPADRHGAITVAGCSNTLLRKRFPRRYVSAVAPGKRLRKRFLYRIRTDSRRLSCAREPWTPTGSAPGQKRHEPHPSMETGGAGRMLEEPSLTDGREPVRSLTIYDVARTAGVSIASVSRVLNGHTTPRPETRERVMRAVQELGFVPDSAARALSSRLKEVVAVVFRRPRAEPLTAADNPEYQDEADSLVFIDVINRGIEIAAELQGFDLLLSSVPVDELTPKARSPSSPGRATGSSCTTGCSPRPASPGWRAASRWSPSPASRHGPASTSRRTTARVC